MPKRLRDMIELTHNSIDTSAVLEAVRSPAAGAVVLFLGTARATTRGRQTRSLDYECYPEMAEKKLGKLAAEARSRFALIDAAVVHRLGHVEIGQISVAVAASAAHRGPAFEAGKWLIDQIKEVVPIWKKENWADGYSRWVHPGLDPSTIGEDA